MNTERQLSGIKWPKDKQVKRQALALLLLLLLFVGRPLGVCARQAANPLPPVSLNHDGKLAYTKDERGNRVPDFSYCGYKQSEIPIPTVPVRMVVPGQHGDATATIQAALDYVASLPVDADGFRGAVLLEKGIYEIAGTLILHASGVVLRGSGMGDDGTILLGTGQDRQTLIQVKGVDNRQLSDPIEIIDSSVPVNATSLSAKGGRFNYGDRICINRPSTDAWISATGTEYFGGGISTLGWKAGNEDINWERTVLHVSGNQLIFDAPITTELDRQYGLSTVRLLQWPGRISQCGVENLQCLSVWDGKNLKDENHRWMAITLENVENAWVRRITFRHFAGSAVYTLETARQVTVEDCKSFEPVGEIGGYRRYTFFNEGQLNLFQRLYAESGFHDFAVGQCAAGPNAFVQCYSSLPYNFSGALGSWASGVLFDLVTVNGNALSYKNRGQDGQGAGWSAANSVFWQCSAAMIDCPKPPTAQNWAFGCWAQFQGDGVWISSNEHIEPASLYYAQLKDRLGKSAMDARLLPVDGEESSAPTFEQAQVLSELARKPAMQLQEWIDTLVQRSPVSLKQENVLTVHDLKTKSKKDTAAIAPLEIKNGWIVCNNQIVTGSRQPVNWWSGNLKPLFLAGTLPHITRFVPGRTGRGLTDDLAAMTDDLCKNHVVALDHHYGLWYDRRRDDHERIRRMDGDVWAPFYEQPFARSGEGFANDGLSKYDLTTWNVWYWNRLKTFADLADRKGLILFHQQYFQHNILEAGAHWVDCPWRTANNVNHTKFPEPVNFAGDKRIFEAEQFYELQPSAYRELHRLYIRKCLDNFSGNSHVIQFISDEFTGPLSFVNFWLDVIDEWEKETGKHELIALSTTKDVQDAILADPVRSKLIDVIDTKYWQYLPDGAMFAPGGALNLAFRQHDRLRRKGIVQQYGKAPSDQAKLATDKEALMYWTVRDYRDAYPDKAVIYSSNVSDAGWPAFMAGGSICSLPAGLPEAFKKAAVFMKPMNTLATDNYWALGHPDKGYIIYIRSGNNLRFNLKAATGRFTAQWLDARTGYRIGASFKVNGGKYLSANEPENSFAVLWLYR